MIDRMFSTGLMSVSPTFRFYIFLCAVSVSAGLQFALHSADIVDPAILEGLRNSICFSEGFESVPVNEKSKLTEGIAGKAYSTTRYYSVNVEKILPQGAGSISWWARHNFDSTAGASLLSLDNGASLYLNFHGTSSSDPRHKEIGHFWSKLSGAAFAKYPGTIKPQTWHNFIITWEGDEMTVYFDGGFCGSAKGSGPFSSMGVKTLTLGNPYADQKKDIVRETLFDELRIYNRAITAMEAKAYFTAFKLGGTVKEMAVREPEKTVSRDTLGLRAAYRLSDHSIQVYCDMKMLGDKQNVDLRLLVTAEKVGKVFEKNFEGVNPKELFYESIPVKDLSDGTYNVEIEVAGKSVRTTFNRHREEWENNKIGVTDKVIDPWTPVTLNDKTISCWGRKYVLGDLGLPKEIMSTVPESKRGNAACELLADPVSLKIEGADGSIKVSGISPKTVQRSEAYVDVSAEGNAGALKIQTSGAVEFDGFYKFKIRIEPTKPVEVKSIRLEIALPDKLACLFNASGENMRGNKAFLDLAGLPDGVLWDSIESNTVNDDGKQKRVKVRREGNIGNFYPHLWFGDDDRGMAFMGDNTRGWILDESKPCQDLIREKNKTILRLHLVNKTVVLNEPLEALLSLQATPVKSRQAGGSWKKVEWYGWGHFDLPVLWKDCFKEYREGKLPANGPWYRGSDAKEKNRWWRYFCFQSHRINREDPSYGEMVQRCADEWGAGLHVPSHIDFIMWSYKQWHDIASMDGNYYDNTFAHPTTALGSGLAWRDAEGKTHGSFNTFGDREFMKRVRTYFLQQGPPAVLKAHVSDAPIVGYLGFSDFWLDGENGGYLTKAQEEKAAKEGRQIYDFVDRWYSKTGLTNLRITLGRQWGVIPQYLYVWGAEATQAMLGMFDIDHCGWNFNGIKDEFGCSEADVDFMPYWGNRHPVAISSGGSPDVFVTAWKRPGRARIMVSNLSPERRTVSLQADLAKLGIPANAIAVDEQSHELLDFSPKDGSIRNLAVNRHGYRVVLLGAPDAFTVIPGTLAKSMYPAKRIERLCDNFSTISPEWQPKGRDGKDNWFGLWGQTLSISGVEGQVMARPFEEDNCSVQVKISTNGSFWDGGPALLLYWKKGYYAGINAGGMRPIPNGPKICCSAVVDGKSVGTGIGPVAESATWVKITLLPETLEFFYSADAKTWSKLQSIPRKGLEGAPSMLLIGTPMPNSEYCVGKGRGDGTVFFGDLVTGRD